MSKKTVENRDPWAPAQPYILQGMAETNRVAQQQQPKLDAFSGMQMDTYGRVAPGAEAGISQAQRAVNANISGETFGQNPGRSTYQGMTSYANPATGMFGAAANDRTANPAIGMIGQAMQGRNPAQDRTSALGDGGFVGQGASADYWRKSLAGDYLNGDSNFNSVVGNTLDDVQRRVNAQFGSSGAVGQTAHSDLLARNLAATNASMRSQNYQAERARQDGAAGSLDGATRGDRAQQMQALGMTSDMFNTDAGRRLQAAGMTGDLYNADAARRMQALGMFGDSSRADADMQMRSAGLLDQGYEADMARQQQGIGQAQDLMRGSQSLLNNAAELPWTSVQAQNGGIRQASNGYGVTTTKTSDPMGFIGGLAGAAATAYASDPKVKRNVVPLGQTAPDGTPLYEYDNLASGRRETGVMATEVAPDARGPEVGGIKTVDYGKVGMPGGPVDMGPVDLPDISKSYTADGDRRGFGGWLDRAISPDTSTTRGKIGLLGHALMAQSGSPFEGLGQGLLGMRKESFDRADTDRRFDIQEKQADALADYRGAMAARPPAGAGRQPALIESLMAAGIDPSSPEGQDIVRRALPGFGYTPEALDRKQGDAIALVEKRAALRPAPVGRRPAAVKATKVIGGKAYYNVGGRWFDNAEGL